MKAGRKRATNGSMLGAGIIATLILILQFWGEIYPIVCPLVRHPDVCAGIGLATIRTLDKMRLDVTVSEPVISIYDGGR